MEGCSLAASVYEAVAAPSRAIALATLASAQSVRHCARTSAIRPRAEERPRDVRDVAWLLRETLTRRGVGQ
jgi:hypothetical protein